MHLMLIAPNLGLKEGRESPEKVLSLILKMVYGIHHSRDTGQKISIDHSVLAEEFSNSPTGIIISYHIKRRDSTKIL